MFCIRFEIGHFNHDPVWTASMANLCADPSPGRIKCRAADCAKLVDPLLVVAIGENRRQIRAFLIRRNGSNGCTMGVSQYTEPEPEYCDPEK